MLPGSYSLVPIGCFTLPHYFSHCRLCVIEVNKQDWHLTTTRTRHTNPLKGLQGRGLFVFAIKIKMETQHKTNNSCFYATLSRAHKGLALIHSATKHELLLLCWVSLLIFLAKNEKLQGRGPCNPGHETLLCIPLPVLFFSI